MTRLPIGQRIRESRQAAGTTQSALARAVGVSPSYLNLIEHDRRMIGGALLKRIAAALEVDLSRLSGAEDAALAQDVAELARTLSMSGLDEESAARFVGQFPEWADAFQQLYRRYRDATETALALSDRLSQDPALMELSHAVLTQISAIRSFAEILEQYPDLEPSERLRFSGIIAGQSDRLGSSAREMIALLDGAQNTPTPTSPGSEVDDFIHHHDNHVPVLERAADDLRRALSAGTQPLGAAIAERLTRRHGVRVRHGGAPDADGAEDGAEDGADDAAGTAAADVLRFEEGLLETTVRFRQARRLAELEMADAIEELVRDERLTSDTARAIARRAMANYAAGALLFPYDAFFEAAEATRYDIDRLGRRFGGSFEQIAHRLVTLRRPDAAGVPFAFLRTDPAGNLSKPFSIPGLRMPRFGGACPLWAIYAAQGSPDRTVSQLAEMPTGEQYLFIAHSQSKRAPAFGGAPIRHSVMLACDAAYGERLVYYDAYASGRASLATPVGFNCRSCPRENCAQRARPAILSTAERRARPGGTAADDDVDAAAAANAEGVESAPPT